jgi:hypothetical protein
MFCGVSYGFLPSSLAIIAFGKALTLAPVRATVNSTR